MPHSNQNDLRQSLEPRPAQPGMWGSVWDLDHTLLLTDSFAEQCVDLLFTKPWLIYDMCIWLLRGRSFCKGRIATLAATSPEFWPVRREILDRVIADRNAGRCVVLATAAHRAIADPFATHLGCFDAVLASDDVVNLKGERKLAAIVQLARVRGWCGFSYAGDCDADLLIWHRANEIVVVDPTPSLLFRLRRLGKPLFVLGTTQTGWAAVVESCRPHQWAKNLLLVLPMGLAHRIDVQTVIAVGIAFVVFCLCASGVYLLNDISDLAADRQHPRKRSRPFASGRLTIAAGLRLAAVLFATGLALSAAFLPVAFLGLMVLYIGANFVYFSRLKRVPVLDVLVLACMYALRLEAGAVAAHVPLSDWLLTFALFVFTSLAFAKRCTELRRLESAGRSAAVGRGYEVGDIRLLEILGSASGYVSVLVLALYMNSDQMRSLYGESRLLWLVCPFVLYWITRLWLLAARGELDEDPVVFAISDRTSLIVGAACGLVVLLARLVTRFPS